MTSLESALITVAKFLLNDAKRLHGDDLGFDIPVTAEVVGGYGVISHILELRENDPEVTEEGRVELAQLLREIRDAAKVSHLVLLDASPDRVQAYKDALGKITSLYSVSI